jgi:selenide,water dikinase
MVAIGLVHPSRLTRNSGVVGGATLVLTKPLGLGMISTAIKQGTASPEMVRDAVEVMTTLNRDAALAVADVASVDASIAATDVTGFGLLGHLHKMLLSSGVSATIDAAAIPFIRGSVDLARQGIAAGGTKRNRAFVDPHVVWGGLHEQEQLLLADAQTSGGLLIATTDPDRLRGALEARGVHGAVIGTTSDREPAGRITVEGAIAP